MNRILHDRAEVVLNRKNECLESEMFRDACCVQVYESSEFFLLFKILARGFCDGTVVKNLPASVGDAGGGV